VASPNRRSALEEGACRPPVKNRILSEAANHRVEITAIRSAPGFELEERRREDPHHLGIQGLGAASRSRRLKASMTPRIASLVFSWASIAGDLQIAHGNRIRGSGRNATCKFAEHPVRSGVLL
jgi:hypothetical protein